MINFEQCDFISKSGTKFLNDVLNCHLKQILYSI